jgi:hypothetical protein
MAQAHPLLGWGFDGFRHACPDPANFRAFPAFGQHLAEGGGAAVCNITARPQCKGLEALAMKPSCILFAAAALAWLIVLGRGIGGGARETLRAGVFVACLVQFWPIASSGSAFDLYTAGIGFTMAGWGVALARASDEGAEDGGAEDERVARPA